jgi:hypothetical protein
LIGNNSVEEEDPRQTCILHLQENGILGTAAIQQQETGSPGCLKSLSARTAADLQVEVKAPGLPTATSVESIRDSALIPKE